MPLMRQLRFGYLEDSMTKAGGIIGLIAGVFGVIATLVTSQIVNVIGSVDPSLASKAIVAGWCGGLSSFLAVMFGAVALSKARIGGWGLLLCSIAGVSFGMKPVGACLLLSLIGGILCLVGAKSELGSAPSTAEPSTRGSSRPFPSVIVTAAVVLIAFGVAFLSRQGSPDAVGSGDDELSALAKSVPADIQPFGELASIFELGSDYTDVQRQNRLSDLKEKVVQWTLRVYEVAKDGERYQIQTDADGAVGTVVYLTPRSPQERAAVEALKTGDSISFRGKIKGVFLRNLVIQPAILWNPEREREQTSSTQTTAPEEPAKLWLDAPLTNWNLVNGIIPKAPHKFENESDVCTPSLMAASTDEDRAVMNAGWVLVDRKTGWGVTIVSAMADDDGMCRPMDYQDFVFVKGQFAGTMAPKPMDSRTEGAETKSYLSSESALEAEFERYSDSDPLCCPSRITRVTYTIQQRSGVPVLVPVSIQTITRRLEESDTSGATGPDAAVGRAPFAFVGTVVNTTNPRRPITAPVRMAFDADGTCALTISLPLVGSGTCTLTQYDENSGHIEIISRGAANISWSGSVNGAAVTGTYRVAVTAESGSFQLTIEHPESTLATIGRALTTAVKGPTQ